MVHVELDKKPFFDGPHKIQSIERLNYELPDRHISLFSKILRILRKLLNDLPDYDSGYFNILAGGNTYYMKHNLGSVPKRATMYYRTNKPDRQMDYVNHVVPFDLKGTELGGGNNQGLYLSHRLDGNWSLIYTRASSLIYGDTSAWLRVLLWR